MSILFGIHLYGCNRNEKRVYFPEEHVFNAGVSRVEINIAISNKNKFMFDFGELVRQMDTVHTKCKLLIYQIDAMQ